MVTEATGVLIKLFLYSGPNCCTSTLASVLQSFLLKVDDKVPALVYLLYTDVA